MTGISTINVPAEREDLRALAEAFDPTRPTEAFYEDPYPTYRALHRFDPVHACPDGSYFLARHADLHRVYRDPRTFSSDKQKQFRPKFGDGPLYEHHTTSLVFNDPPLHTHVRKAIGDALSQKTLVAMEPPLRALVQRLLDGLEKKPEFDFMDDFASIIPVEVIGNLLRIPREDRGRLRRWAAAILGALEFNLPKEKLELGNQCVREFVDYLRDFVADRRGNLSDDDDDILSRLIRWESEGLRLSDAQLYHQCIFLLNAGHETTTNLIGNGMHALLAHPEEAERLRRDPSLIRSAVEEVLRFESPVQLGNRLTTCGVEFGGLRIPAGTTLTLGIGAANRDPAAYPDPDRLDISRNPRDHLAFGGGIHTCVGLNVARLEARIAIPAVLDRFPEMRLNGVPRRDHRARFRGFASLPMAIR
ncbi:MAG: cytochrome P450 [Gammaproteobacteria bacterium]|nr:cytochrome P450 [Gammaproteobacteria bacterium]